MMQQKELLGLLSGFFQARCVIGGQPQFGGGVATIFRGRPADEFIRRGERPRKVSDLSYPPSLVDPLRPEQNRCNRAGRSVFYGSFSRLPIPRLGNR